jgi:O-antigen ligase
LAGAVVANLLGVFLTFSRGGLMGLFTVIGLIGWRQKSIVIRGLMVLGLVGAISVGGLYWNRNQTFKDISKDTTFNQRIATIRAGIAMFEARPLLGVGPGCSIVAYPIYVPEDAHCGCQLQLVIHNSFIQVLSEIGILGFTVSMLFLGISIWDARKMQKGPYASYASALEIALWGCVVCGFSGGFTYTWWPYILIGLVVALKHISASKPLEGANESALA